MHHHIIDSVARDTWFTLSRHDADPPADPPTPDPAPEPDATPPADPPEPDDPPDKGDDKDWKAEAEKWKALSRKHEAAAKTNKSAADKLAEIEDAQKTEAEKLAAKAEAAEAKAAAAVRRAVRAEIKALAADDFADPTDADGAVDPAEFVDDSGDIDVNGIKAKLAELLAAKPHWRKTAGEPQKPKAPKPDPGQGPRNTPTEPDIKNASKEEFAAELAKHRLSPRS